MALVAGAAALVILLLAFRIIARADPARLAAILRLAGAVVMAVFALVTLVTGRLMISGMFASVAFALLGWSPQRWRGFMHRRNASAQSEVATEWIQMTLDHESGVMSGRIHAGPFRGRTLAELDPSEMLDLLDQARTADPDGAALIETYLDRTGPADWRETYAARGGAAASAGTSGAMTRDEALKILGLSEKAGPDEIRAAHRRLMRNFHPDAGGSTYLAAKINQAKDLLLG